MNDIKVLESFLPRSYRDELERNINSVPFKWSFHDQIATEYGEVSYNNSKIHNPIGLSHTFIDQGKVVSEQWEMIRPILLFLEYHEDFEIQQVLRVRARRTMRENNIDVSMYNPPHVDLPNAQPYKTLIYYLNDSDGDTIFFDEIWTPRSDMGTAPLRGDVKECFRYTPIKGNGILFNGHRYHSGNSPINNLHRTIINFDFIA